MSYIVDAGDESVVWILESPNDDLIVIIVSALNNVWVVNVEGCSQ